MEPGGRREGGGPPLSRHETLPRAEFRIADEIYQFREWSRDKVHVLMSIDTSTVDLTKKDVARTDKDFAVAWSKSYGKGRVFYCSLGHRPEVWERADIRQMWTAAIQWAMGR